MFTVASCLVVGLVSRLHLVQGCLAVMHTYFYYFSFCHTTI